jgi:hypothetical protein
LRTTVGIHTGRSRVAASDGLRANSRIATQGAAVPEDEVVGRGCVQGIAVEEVLAVDFGGSCGGAPKWLWAPFNAVVLDTADYVWNDMNKGPAVRSLPALSACPVEARATASPPGCRCARRRSGRSRMCRVPCRGRSRSGAGRTKPPDPSGCPRPRALHRHRGLS